jgi:haloacetate dehalogenase
MAAIASMFEGFALDQIDVGEGVIRVRHGGSGPPLLLLRGYPQTHVMWHKVAPLLARDFTIVAPDLRGYGDSFKPPSTSDHAPYSKRVMARDQVEVMRQLGFERFFVAGHDGGGHCAYRMALDHPTRVLKLATLDIIPTGEAFRRINPEFALGYWHWFFLAAPCPLPENLICANPEGFFFPNRDLFDSAALAEYLRAVRQPETIHAICEDYRAAATLDYQYDEADRYQRKIRCPLLVLWGRQGKLEQWYDVLESGAIGQAICRDAPLTVVIISLRKHRKPLTQRCTPFSSRASNCEGEPPRLHCRAW